VVAPFAHDALPLHPANLQWFDLTTGPFDARVEELIRSFPELRERVEQVQGESAQRLQRLIWALG
jgi:hypothetical protein